MSFLQLLWLAPVTMLLWRFQGGAWFAAKLPGRPVWYVIPILAALAWLLHGGWQAPAVTAAGLMIVTFFPHGRWYTLNNQPRELAGPPSRFEAWLEWLCDRSGRDDHLCLFMAKTIAFAPFVLIALAMHWPFAFLAGLFVPFIILKGYRIGWRLHGDGATAVPTAFGEYFAGLAIALLLLGMD